MDFADYVEDAARTLPDVPQTEALDKCALGLAGEAREIVTADKATLDEEAGDGWWYVAAGYLALEVVPSSYKGGGRGHPIFDLFEGAGRVAESTKKVLHHGEDLGGHSHVIRAGLHQYAAGLSKLTQTPDHEVWRQNLSKLRERWPDGFEPGG